MGRADLEGKRAPILGLAEQARRSREGAGGRGRARERATERALRRRKAEEGRRCEVARARRRAGACAGAKGEGRAGAMHSPGARSLAFRFLALFAQALVTFVMYNEKVGGRPDQATPACKSGRSLTHVSPGSA